jgi:predicted nuclease of restriction endonuclease-like (RecB) superfamily
MKKASENSLGINKALFNELSKLIEESKRQANVQANSTLTILYWKVGSRIGKEILKNKRAAYAKAIVSTLSTQLTERYGKSFEERNLRRMIQFAEQFTEFEIVVTLSRKLSWGHFVELLPLKTMDAKIYYSNAIVAHQMGIRELRKQISQKSFERTEIANLQNKNSEVINSFKDPYLLDFLGLHNSYLEEDLEAALLVELESFILELGKGFAFIERQKRMIIDGEDFYLDLLFYNRKLRRLVAVELKLGKFEAKHKGQMELYLKWLARYEQAEGEEQPVGLILCAESSREQIELLEMHKDRIMVAEYWTELPPKKQFEKKIHSLLIEARERIEKNKQLKK